MMIGIVNINGFIGESSDEFGNESNENTSFIDLVSQIESNKEATAFHVMINSEGGFVEDGYRMYNYLKNVDKPVTTIIKDYCYSIATVIFLAGTRRIINKDSKFMIHAPWMRPDPGNASEIQQEIDSLKSVENDMINFYAKNTGSSKASFKYLIETDTYITPEQAVALGFATEISDQYSDNSLIPYRAVAFSNKLTNKPMINNKELKGLLDSFEERMKKWIKPKHVNIVLQDSNGTEINFPELEEGQSPAVGDTAMIDGVAIEDGSYILPQISTTLVFEGGVITEVINDSEQEEQESEMSALRSQIEQLKIDLSQAQDQLAVSIKDNESFKSEASALHKDLKKLKALAGHIEPSTVKELPKKEGHKKTRRLMKESYYQNN